MKRSYDLITPLAIIALTAATGFAKKGPPLELAGVICQTPPPLHCPEAKCPSEMVIEQGTAVEPKTGRKFFLDYPCDLKRGEKVTFILSLHGAGSYGNWQRHYFPIVDYKDKYRLVIATPNSPTHIWSDTDDEYLQNIVNLVYEQVGKENIKAFWLVGHSQGGMTSNRLVRTDFFSKKVDGWLSLSGGRLGGSPGRSGNFGPPRTGAPGAGGRPALRVWLRLRQLCANFRPPISRSSMKRASTKWMRRACLRRPHGPRNTTAVRGSGARM